MQLSCMTRRSHAPSTLHDGTVPPIQTWHLLNATTTAIPNRAYPGHVAPVTPPRSLITTPALVPPVQGRDVKRWNFRKTNWAGFTKQVNKAAAGLPNPGPNNMNDTYESYYKILLAATKKNIPCSVCKAYVPCWDEQCEELLRAHVEAKISEDRDKAADALFCRLNDKHRRGWTETGESIDFTHSSHRVWQTFNKLTGRSTTPAQCPITANCIASLLLSKENTSESP